MKHFFLLLSGWALVAGCGADSVQNLPTPATGDDKSTIHYIVNGRTITQEARLSYQPATPPTRNFDVLNIEAGDTARSSGGPYVQVVFLKGAGRPESEYGVVAIRYFDPTTSLTWGIGPRGTLGRWNGGWRGSFSGVADDRLGPARALIEGEFINVR
ncbi:hypothetical protein MUN81_07680 [Hymenobacter sp. 5317J-9]|uniref:hypothetical protein n=1 Tax=Hymenobacter sp. 5317J-9 TaxID=2932250 RepID=UPI001FD6A6D0|nr:hypothetical protein [Hymenobacter sp. 5317J-9]UOQ99369.1 hypothetical protein MUN81_07680 [Hymenobacter sp. 5317J-9]